MDKEFQCCKCSLELNLQDRIPFVLPSCGHSICQECVINYIQSELILVCNEDAIQCQVPRDKTYFPTNKSVIELLKKKGNNQHQRHVSLCENHIIEVSEFNDKYSVSQSQSSETLPKLNLCQLHFKPLELICQQDGQYICVNCALFGTHKFHNYKPMEIYIKEMEQKCNQITILFEEFQQHSTLIEQHKYLTQFEQDLAAKKTQTLHSIDLKYEELFDDLRLIQSETKNQTIKNFNIYFEETKIKLEKEFKEIKQEIDNWLKTAGQQLNVFLDSNYFIIDDKILENGKMIEQKIQEKQHKMDIEIQQLVNSFDITIPTQAIKQCFQNKQNENNLKGLLSETLISDIPFLEQQTEPSSPKILVDLFSRKKIASQTQTPLIENKLRSHTFLQTEPNLDITNHNQQIYSNQKAQKLSKFSQNIKMNEKINSCIALLDKQEIVDLSQLDLSNTLLQTIGESLKKQIVKVLKMSKCKITDELLAKLLNIIQGTSVATLHLQSNLLSEKSLDLILNMVKTKNVELKQIYANGNAIQVVKCKKKIEELKKMGVQVLI